MSSPTNRFPTSRPARAAQHTRRRRKAAGGGLWAGLVATIALLGLGGWAALQIALGTVEASPATAAAASAAEPSPTRAVVVFASSERPSAPVSRTVPTDRTSATPTPSDWFATATAGQAAARSGGDELAARSLSSDAVRWQTGSSTSTPRPPAPPRGDATPTPARRPASAPVATETAPPAPIVPAATRASAQAAPPRATATRTPRPAPSAAPAAPSPRVGAATSPDEPGDRASAAAGAAFRVDPPTPARRAASPTRISGYDTVVTRVAQAAARRAPTGTPTYQRRAPQWTPRAAGPTSIAPTPTLSPSRTARPLQTPAPVATRAAFTPPPTRNGANKWGVGVYRDSNRVLDVIRETQPGVILLMDPGDGWARKVRATAPNAFIVGRRYKREDDQPLDNPTERGEEMADWVAEVAVPLKGVVDAWMSYNEVVNHDAFDDYRRYNQFQVAFAHRLQNVHGVAAVAGNDGSGAVEPEDYPRYFAEAIRASQYFGLHAYSPPATSRMDVDAEWNALRYRKVHDELERAGIRGKQMVFTESGLGDGFRNGVASDEEMAEDFVWFTREMVKDSYVIGQAAFGLFDGTGAWDRFELTDSNVPRVVRQLLR